MTSTLTRDPVTVCELGDTFDRAKELLGYTPSELTENRAAAVLRDLGIHPFRRSCVDEYKAKKADEINAPIAVAWRQWRMRAIPLGGIGACLLMLCVLVCWLSGLGEGGTTAMVFLVGAPGCICWIIAICWFNGAMVPDYQTWGTTQLKNFGDPIPEFVLQTALDVSERLKAENIEHHWYVDVLGHHKNRDPFLVLGASKLFYLEVWNEPSFAPSRRELAREETQSPVVAGA